MNEQWQELKETIVELRDNNGTGTQQEVCKFLANYMDILEKQITDGWIPCSERLPEEGQKVLVTCMFEAVTTAIYFKKSPFWREVVAWRELPQPYKESEVSNAK